VKILAITLLLAGALVAVPGCHRWAHVAAAGLVVGAVAAGAVHHSRHRAHSDYSHGPDVTVHYDLPYCYYGSSYYGTSYYRTSYYGTSYYGPSYYRTSYPAPVYRASRPTRVYSTPRSVKVRPFRGRRR